MRCSASSFPLPADDRRPCSLRLLVALLGTDLVWGAQTPAPVSWILFQSRSRQLLGVPISRVLTTFPRQNEHSPRLRAVHEALSPEPLAYLPADLRPSAPRFVTARGQGTNGQQPRVTADVSYGPLSGRFDLPVLSSSRLALKDSLRGSAPLSKPALCVRLGGP